MIFNWNIFNSSDQTLPPDLAKPKIKGTLYYLLKPLSWFKDYMFAFRLTTLKELRYNCQTEIFQSLLNDLYDPSLRRIRINTTEDLNDEVFIGQQINNGEENDLVYIGQQVTNSYETDEVYIGQESDYLSSADFIVTAAVGSLTAAQIVQLKSTVNKYRFDSLLPYYQYSDGTPF